MEQKQQLDRTGAGPQCWNRGPETLGMSARRHESCKGPRGKKKVDGQEGILFLVSRRETAEQFRNILTFGTTLWLLTQYQPFLARICWALQLSPFLRVAAAGRGLTVLSAFSPSPHFWVLFFPPLLFFFFSNLVSCYGLTPWWEILRFVLNFAVHKFKLSIQPKQTDKSQGFDMFYNIQIL